MLLGLSQLEIALLISFRRLVLRKGNRSLPFDTVFSEYSSMYLGEGQQHRNNHRRAGLVDDDQNWIQTSDLYGKPLAWKAWTRLMDAELLEPDIGVKTGGRQQQSVRLTVDMDDIKAAIDKHDGVGATLRAWGTTWIT